MSTNQEYTVPAADTGVRLVVCDDHLAFAEAIATVLARSGHSVVEVTATPDDAIAACQRHEPDMCLMDLTFPDAAGYDAVATVADHGVTVVVVTASTDGSVVRDAFGTGARGVVSKASGLDSLLDCVERVAAGDDYCDPSLPHSTTPVPLRRQEPAALLAAYLTPREREVLERMVRGESTGSMSTSMHVSVTTVRSHVQSVLSKLNVGTRVAAVAYATAHGIVSPPRLGAGRDESARWDGSAGRNAAPRDAGPERVEGETGSSRAGTRVVLPMDQEPLAVLARPWEAEPRRTAVPGPPASSGYHGASRLRRRQLHHDIRHQLGMIMMLTSVIDSSPEAGPRVRSRAEQVLGEARWMEQLLAAYDATDDIAEQSRVVEPVRLDRMTGDLVAAFQLTHRTDVTLRADEACAAVDGLALWRASRNLIDNAVRAAGDHGRVVVRTFTEYGWAVLQVEDDGPGVGRGPSGRASLGLGIVRAVVAETGGTFELGVGDLGGCRARVRIPMAVPGTDAG